MAAQYDDGATPSPPNAFERLFDMIGTIHTERQDSKAKIIDLWNEVATIHEQTLPTNPIHPHNEAPPHPPRHGNPVATTPSALCL